MTQRQEFQLLKKYDDFELRRYLPCVVAEVEAFSSNSIQSSSAFGSLFNYISQGNKKSQKIAMTAPVISTQKANSSESSRGIVSFVMPSGSKIEQMPDPNDSQVKLRELEAETCVAKSFRGRATEELSRKVEEGLRASTSQAGITLSNETRICRFDPPFKPGFLQYNEIVIPVKEILSS